MDYRYGCVKGFVFAAAVACGVCASAAKKKAPPVPSGVPELMKTSGGRTVATVDEWEKIRRPEILKCFEENEFGIRPASVADGRDVSFTVVSEKEVLGGRAVCKLVKAVYAGPYGKHGWQCSFVAPKGARNVPVFLLMDVGRGDGLSATDDFSQERWPAGDIVARGFATVYVFKEALAPDDKNARCVKGIFSAAESPGSRNGKSWATISAWAWGNSRIIDWLGKQPEADASRIAVVGHSRGGKTALWTGATDPRVALVCSVQSGCAGAKLNHIALPRSEHIEAITRNFPHWFCGDYRAKYAGKEFSMPFDQHWLAALIAPRLLVISSATEDVWAGPRGEWWTARLASPAWELYGRKGLVAESFPRADSPQQDGSVAYHVRTGRHSLVRYDWARYMDFAEKHGWKGMPPRD